MEIMYAGFEPLSRALADYQRGDREATLVVWRDDGFAEPLPAAHFFRTPDELSALEREALACCRGRVLDAEALAGSNALALQSAGRKVFGRAFDAAVAALLDDRGLLEHGVVALESLGGPFDTILNVNPGFGLAPSEDGLERYLRACRDVVAPDGQLILYSRDADRPERPLYALYAKLNRRAGRPAGEVRGCFEYGGDRGAAFRWVHFDAERLAAAAAASGWRFDVVAEDGRGDYLARLVPAGR